MDEFYDLLAKAEKIYPDNDVLKSYRLNYRYYDLSKLKRNLRYSIQNINIKKIA